ncbi:molecular chaperone DnaJ [Acinetobacter sp. MD2]|uniref:molecular chaperone DnaJ n=1 Tax=Acinetobacter sp. MD2 TaxID=2600066 RepID=UPI002D1EAEDE|nr:molecular chaperone DnaJ [Acinetobacter sp. MD2]MEB3767583.1 molecular chaperone DnaJ [Acinetobacter sp. MD2]
MSFSVRIRSQPKAELSLQHKKLNTLIEQIEQQKITLKQWQHAQADIQQYVQQKLMPIYRELHEVLFQQLQQLSKLMQSYSFSKAEILQLDAKMMQLVQILKSSKLLTSVQLEDVLHLDRFYQQFNASQNKKNKTVQQKNDQSFDDVELNQNKASTEAINEDFEYHAHQHQQAKEQAKQQRLQQKREKAELMATQSLKTVYLKITALIHPDREQDETKKVEKTALFQQVSQAYEQQDLFYLLKLQLQLEQNKSFNNQPLSAEQVKFYQLALQAQSVRLDSQMDEILQSLHVAKQVNIAQVYKSIDADCTELKQQLTAEKKRLQFMGKASGVEMLLESYNFT